MGELYQIVDGIKSLEATRFKRTDLSGHPVWGQLESYRSKILERIGSRACDIIDLGRRRLSLLEKVA